MLFQILLQEVCSFCSIALSPPLYGIPIGNKSGDKTCSKYTFHFLNQEGYRLSWLYTPGRGKMIWISSFSINHLLDFFCHLLPSLCRSIHRHRGAWEPWAAVTKQEAQAVQTMAHESAGIFPSLFSPFVTDPVLHTQVSPPCPAGECLVLVPRVERVHA